MRINAPVHQNQVFYRLVTVRGRSRVPLVDQTVEKVQIVVATSAGLMDLKIFQADILAGFASSLLQRLFLSDPLY